MIVVGHHATNYFTLVGDSLGEHPTSSIALHSVQEPSVKDPSVMRPSYKWTIEVNAKGGNLETSSLPRSFGRAGVLAALKRSLEGLEIDEELDEEEVLEYVERLHKAWVYSAPIGPARAVAEALSEPEVRWDLVRHLKAQIEKDPLAYANDHKIMACLDKVVADLRYEKAMDENDHGNHHNNEEDDCPCYTCQVRRSERGA